MSVISRIVRSSKSVLSTYQRRRYTGSNTNESPLKGILKDAASFNEDRSDASWATQPYSYVPEQERVTERVDARETSIVLFPGQGTQYIGMGKSLLKYPNVKELYECASEVAQCYLTNITNEKDLEKHCQILVVVSSLAAVERMQNERPSIIPSCVATGGFSLGEITALIFGGAIPLEQGLQLVNIRSLAMEAASRDNPGGMLTVIYGPDATLNNLFADAKEYAVKNGDKIPVCGIANYLYPQCCVISASENALKFVEGKGKNYGIRKTKRLNVSGAFHSEIMESAVEPVQKALQLCELTAPKIPVYSAANVKKIYRTPDMILKLLPKQIVLPVKWEQLMHFLYARPRGQYFPRTVEVGPGRSLRSILRKVNAPAWDNSMSITCD